MVSMVMPYTAIMLLPMRQQITAVTNRGSAGASTAVGSFMTRMYTATKVGTPQMNILPRKRKIVESRATEPMRRMLRRMRKNARLAAVQKEMPWIAIRMYALRLMNFMHFSMHQRHDWMRHSTIFTILPMAPALPAALLHLAWMYATIARMSLTIAMMSEPKA